MTIRLNRTESALFLLIQAGHLYPDGAAGVGKHYTTKLKTAIHTHSYGGPAPVLHHHRPGKHRKIYQALATAIDREGYRFYQTWWPRKGSQAILWRMAELDATLVHVRRVRGAILVTGSMTHPTRGARRMFCSDMPVRDFVRMAAANLGAYRSTASPALGAQSGVSSGNANMQNLPRTS